MIKTETKINSLFLHQIPFEQIGQLLMRTVHILPIDPIKKVLYYLVPCISAHLSSQSEIRSDNKAQISLLPQEAKQEVIDTIGALCKAAGLTQEDIDTYASLDEDCSSYGGSYSLTHPVLSIPLQYLTALSNSIAPADIAEKDRHWVFDRDEASFFIAREIAQIHSTEPFDYIAKKILFVSSLYFVYMSPLSIFYSALLMAGSVYAYIKYEKAAQAKLDIRAVDILSKHFGDLARAHQVGYSALGKLQKQNLERRSESNLYRYFITQSGNNILDLTSPALTSRKNALARRALERK